MTDPELLLGRRTPEHEAPRGATNDCNDASAPNEEADGGLARSVQHRASQTRSEDRQPNSVPRLGMGQSSRLDRTPEKLEDVTDDEASPQSPLRWALAGLVLVGGFALKEAIFWNPPLSFTVGAARHSGVLHDWEEADDAALPLRFSDGTRLDLEPRARAQVTALGRAGAAIALESGRAHVSVVPVHFRVPGEMPWRIDFGPLSVEAKAARFDVDWDPRSDELTLDLFEGTITLDGCEGGPSHTVSAGPGARVSCGTRHWSLKAPGSAHASEPPRSGEPIPPPPTPAPPPTATPTTAS
jgi:hypothetical protein